MNIVVLEASSNNPGDLSWKALESCGTLTVHQRASQDDLERLAGHADVVVSSKIRWNAQAFSQVPRLKLLCVMATGHDMVDLAEARKRGITVCNAPDYSTPSVAQMTFALLLEVCMRTGARSQSVLRGVWAGDDDPAFWRTPLVELAGKQMGIVGMGGIGQEVCRIAQAFGMRTAFANRSPKPAWEAQGAVHLPLDKLLATCDVVSLHVPATPETTGMIDASALDRMKDGALLLNTARGTLVDEQAVADALRTGKLGGFGADVVSAEPVRPDNPLLHLQGCNVVLTPHIGWATRESQERLMATIVENVRAFLAGRPRNVVS